MTDSTLTRLPVPPGPEGLKVVRAGLESALTGGPAVAPMAEGDAVLARIVRPDDPAATLEGDDIAVVVGTSGSTGHPHGVLLSRSAIKSAADALQSVAGGPSAWLVAMPVHHVGGLMVVARAVLAGTPTYPTASLGGASRFTAEGFIADARNALAQADADGLPLRISLVPTQLARLAGSPAAIAELARFDAVLSGAAATSDALAQRLRESGVRLLVSYGMSETCGGCVYNGIPLPGVQIELDAGGRITVAGEVVAHGYRLDPEATARAFRPPAADGRRAHVTGDLGRFSAGVLDIIGRVDDQVKVGGVAVSLEAVAGALRADPHVADAAVVARPDAEWGSVPIAFVVPAGSSGQQSSHAGLAALVAGVLGAAAAPREIRLIDQIPLLPSGKIDRRALEQAAADLPRAATDPSKPTT